MKRILIVDEHEILRDGVKQAFVPEAQEAIFGEASTFPEALKLVIEQDWDLVVMAMSLGNRSGLDVLKRSKEVRPRMPVLILSRYSEEQFVRRALRAGASGYVTKDDPRAELIKAIHKVMNGGRYLSPNIEEKLFFNLELGPADSLHEALSDREFEVFRLIASGNHLREIATMLSLSKSTVSTHRTRILKKMRMETSADLTRYALQHGLID